MRPNFKEAQDFGRKTLAERKYPAPPPSPAHGDSTSAKNDAISASTATIGATEESTSAPKDIPSLDPLNDPAQNVADATANGSPASTEKTTKRAIIQKAPKSNSAPPSTDTASAQPAANPSPTENTEADSESATQKKSRSARTTTSGTNDLPKRSELTPDSANVSTPIPPPLSETELNAMTKDELQTAMGKVAIARQSAEVDDDTKKRLKEEFDRLKNYLKGKK
jgi:hypothetical protein